MNKKFAGQIKASIFLILLIVNAGALTLINQESAINFAMRVTSIPLTLLMIAGGSMLLDKDHSNSILIEFLLLLLASGFSIWGIYDEGMAGIGIITNIATCFVLSIRSFNRLKEGLQ